MKNDIFDPENNSSSDEQMSKDKLQTLYSETIKKQLDALKSRQFIGTSEENVSEDEASCVVKMNSQYEALEVVLNPIFLNSMLNEMAKDTPLEIDQLVQLCVTIGEVAKLAFNKARKKIHDDSEKVFNHLMEEMQGSLFDSQDS